MVLLGSQVKLLVLNFLIPQFVCILEGPKVNNQASKQKYPTETTFPVIFLEMNSIQLSSPPACV